MNDASSRIRIALRLTIGGAIFVLVAMNCLSADAKSRQGTYVYATSTSGASLVGSLNKDLSIACRRQQFNQLRAYHFVIKFKGDKDTGISGVATTNWNLYDPRRLAQPQMTFHFFNDGYSNCRVYVSPQ